MFAILNHLWIYFFTHWRRRRGSTLRSNVYCIYVWKLCGSFCRYPISGHFLSPTGKANSIPFQRPFGLFAFPHSLSLTWLGSNLSNYHTKHCAVLFSSQNMHAVAQEQQSSGVEKTSADFCVWRLFFSFLLCRIAFDEEVATQKQNTAKKRRRRIIRAAQEITMDYGRRALFKLVFCTNH